MTPSRKLLAALLIAAALPLTVAAAAGSFATAARALLAGCALAAIAAWWRHNASTSFHAVPRLRVVQRVGLSSQSALALVELDGRPWLVVHGAGYARLRPVRGTPARKEVRP